MKRKVLILSCISLLAFSSCDTNNNAQKANQTAAMETETNDLSNVNVVDDVETNQEMNLSFSSAANTNVSGSANFTQEGDEVTMVVHLDGLEQGTHAIHIHENGDCSSPDLKSAGGHWNPTTDPHGKFNEGEFHMGDIGNVDADANGSADLTFTTDKWCLDCDDTTKSIIGKSIIVHAGADDYTSQPSGAAGSRVACVVIDK